MSKVGGARKKAVYIPFQKGTGAVAIDLSPYHIGLESIAVAGVSSVTDIMCSLKFVESMSNCESLSDQVKLIAISKPLLKAAISSSVSSDAVKLDLSILCFIFFSPFSFAIRKSMDWIIDYVKKLFDSDPQVASFAISDACQKSLAVSRALLQQQSSSTLSLDTYMGISFSLNALALIDRDVPWISLDRTSIDSNDGHFSGTICDMFTLAQMCIRKCTEYISPDVASSDTVSAEIMRFSECCADALRMVMNVVKSNWNVSVCRLSSIGQVTNAEKIVSISDLILIDSCKILSNELAHKDLIGSASMAIACMHWLNRKPEDTALKANSADATGRSARVNCSNQMNCELPSIQLINFVDIMLQTDATNNAVKGEIRMCGIHRYFIESISSYAPLSKSAIVRAFLSVYEDKYLKSMVENSSSSSYVAVAGGGGKVSILSGPFLKLALFYCQHSHAVRFFGLQILESWFIKVESIILKHKKNEDLEEENDGSICSYKVIINELFANISAIVSNLMINWAHPAKSVSHMVPNVYENLVNVLHLLNDEPDVDVKSVWDLLLKEALAQSMQHRVRYHSLNILLGKVGASAILRVKPNLIEELIDASKLRDISSSITSLVVSIIKSYQVQKGTLEAARALWTRPMANALTSSDKKLSSAAADFLLKEILVVDKTSIPDVIAIVKSMQIQMESSTGKAATNGANLHTLFALVNLCQHAKMLSLAGCDVERSPTSNDGDNIRSSSSSSGTASSSENNLRSISYDELVSACLHENDDLRYAALTVLVICQQTCQPMRAIDFEILKKTFRFSLKSAEGEFRQKLARIVKFLMNRVMESTRISLREQAKSKSKIAALERGSQEDALEKIKLSRASIDDCQKIIDLNIDICRWLSDELVNNMYPGCTFEREVMSIEILLNIIDLLDQDGNDNSLIKSFFLTKSVTQSVFSASLSNWDRSRSLACSLLLKLPLPLPGFDSDALVLDILNWGKQLVTSARQRESETGAFLLKTVMSIYCKKLGWEIQLSSGEFSVSSAVPSSTASRSGSGGEGGVGGASSLPSKSLLSLRSMHFISSICDLLELQIVKLDRLFRNVWVDNSKTELENMNDTEESYLCHGILNTILICLSDCHESNIFADCDSANNEWTPFFQRILSLSLKCLETAMLVIAEAATDVHFAPIPNKSEVKGKNGEDIAVPTRGGAATGLAATYVNANSVVGTNNGGGGGGSGVTSSNDESAVFQKTVVGAWLLVREAANTLAKLVAMSPLPDVKASYQVLSIDTISSVGFTILGALGRLKHLGAIAETQNAMQTICEVLLRYGDRNPTLCRLPRVWLDSLISRLRNEEQIFILRRSAGFAFSFLSLLKGEPSNCKSSLMPIALSNLTDIIESGIASKTGESWKMAVHSLNVVRMIILDAALGNEIDAFVDRVTYLAMEGFKSDTWAVQNSSMMCFSAIVQRTIDNDKSGNSGALQSCSAEEYFARYPKLYPYIVRELAAVSKCKVLLADNVDACRETPITSTFTARAIDSDGGLNLMWPLRIDDSASIDIDMNGLHPSLYPILLMLSKFRSPILNSSSSSSSSSNTSNSSKINDAEESDFDEDKLTSVKSSVSGNNKVELQLFCKLIEKCRSSRYQYVRVMAAKALRALTSVVDSIPYIISEIEVAIEGFAKRVRMNKLHGLLLTIEELLGNVSIFLTKSAVTLDMLIYENINEKTRSGNILEKLNIRLSELFCYIVSISAAPTIHCTFIKILKQFQNVFGKVIATGSTPGFYVDLLSSVSLHVLGSIKWLRSDRNYKGKSLSELGQQDNHIVSTPCLPIAWKMAAEIIALNCLKSCISSFSLASSTPFTPLPLMEEAEVLAAVQACVYSSPDIRYIFTLMHRTHESEIREGVLSGIDSFMNEIDNGNVAGASSTSSIAGIWFKSLQYYVLRVLLTEREPPVLVLSLQVFMRLMSRSSDLNTFNTGTLIPEFYTSLCRVLSVTVKNEALGICESNVDVAQTSSAAYSLEILGWVVNYDMTHSDKWLMWIDICSREWQNAMLRSAAISSIEHFLEAHFNDVVTKTSAADGGSSSSSSSHFIGYKGLVRLWLVVVRLIQDDDDEIRDAANRVVGILYAACLRYSTPSLQNNDVYYRPNSISLYTIEHLDRSIGQMMAQWLKVICGGKEEIAAAVVVLTVAFENPLHAEAAVITKFVEETLSFSEVMDQLNIFALRNETLNLNQKQKEKEDDCVTEKGSAPEDRVFEVEELNLFIEPVKIANTILSAAKCCIGDARRIGAFGGSNAFLIYFMNYFHDQLFRIHVVFSRIANSKLQIAFGGSTFNKAAYALYQVFMKQLKLWCIEFKDDLSGECHEELKRKIEDLLRSIEGSKYHSALHPTLLSL